MLNAGQWPVLVTEAVLGSMIGPGDTSKNVENCSLFLVTLFLNCAFPPLGFDCPFGILGIPTNLSAFNYVMKSGGHGPNASTAAQRTGQAILGG